MDHWGWFQKNEKKRRKQGGPPGRSEWEWQKEERKYRWRDRLMGRNREQDTDRIFLTTFHIWKWFIWKTFLYVFIYIGDSTFLFQTKMQHICLALLSSLSLHLVFLCIAEEGLEFPNFDGKDRVLDINERNYKKALKRYHLLCLFYHEPIPANKGLQKRFQMTELVLEVRTDSGVNLAVWFKVAIIYFISNYFIMLLAQNMDFLKVWFWWML